MLLYCIGRFQTFSESESIGGGGDFSLIQVDLGMFGQAVYIYMCMRTVIHREKDDILLYMYVYRVQIHRDKKIEG